MKMESRFLARKHVNKMAYVQQCFSAVFLESAIVIRDWQRAFL